MTILTTSNTSLAMSNIFKIASSANSISQLFPAELNGSELIIYLSTSSCFLQFKLFQLKN